MNEKALEGFQKVLARVEDGQAVLFTGGPYHINGVGPGRTLNTAGEVRHAGFGLFLAKVPGGYGKSEISFDGGGAMNSITGDDGGYVESWTLLRAESAQLEYMGYDFDVIKGYIFSRMAELEG